ncbi:MAG: 50S ribosome-binding GTPase [Syntrophaceae bacterium]|nr:50S ribosome-binding GTPase [Syntrophaceae bacterium]
MPANLTPQYLEAEAKFKQAKTTPEKIKALEVMMAVIPKHKGTEKLRGQLKSRMAKLKEELQKKPTIGKAEQAYNIKREGVGQVVLLGLPNSGKSSLFSQVTHAFSEVGEYPFTTQKPIAGMMKFENVQIQMVDTPPIQLDRVEPGLSNLIRTSDAVLLIVDLTEDPVFQIEVIQEELRRMKIEMVGKGATPPLEVGWVSRKALILGNKCDREGAMEGYRAISTRFGETFPILPISAKGEMNIEELKKEVYQLLGIIRVYTKAPGKDPDLTEPVVLKKGSTVEDVALSIHKDFVAKLRYARIWGSGKFGGQMVRRDHQVNEGDVIELHI